MNDYEAKQEARKQRMLNLADRMQSASDAAYKRARDMASVIPMGQPILVGHHSEKRDRNYRARIWRTQDRCLELQRKAEYFRGRAASVGKGGISSDNPDAPEQLRGKLAGLEALQARMKVINAAHKRFLKDPASLDAVQLDEADKALIRNYKPAYSWEPHPFAPFQISNNNANIKRVRDRITSLGQRPTETTEHQIGQVRIVENAEANRLQMFFPGKPADDIRKALKSAGFHWSPTEGAWQRQISNAARWYAEQVAGKLV